MAQVINTNIASLTAQRNLNSTQSQLQTSLNRLSSGLRVNSAKDDAAGLAIAERFTTQIKGMTVASRNANDAISLSQTAEGAMQEITNNLQRIRELAVQASNYTNSSDDRIALNNEVQELLAEIDRVAETTEFNGQKLLDGKFETANFQIGANAGETISITEIQGARISELGATYLGTASFDAAVPEATGDAAEWGHAALTIGDFSITVGEEAFNFTGANYSFDAEADGEFDTREEAEDAAMEAWLDAAGRLVSEVNANSRTHGVTAEIERDDDGEVTGKIVFSGQVGNIDGTNLSGFEAEDADPLHLSDLNVLEFEDAQVAIQIADSALDAVNTARSEMGAYQNRFESVIANLSIAVENLSASRSRIQDADFAAETAALTRGQILQQAGTAMLAQANSMPQSVLSLLQ